MILGAGNSLIGGISINLDGTADYTTYFFSKLFFISVMRFAVYILLVFLYLAVIALFFISFY
jgi:hypothetical protein